MLTNNFRNLIFLTGLFISCNSQISKIQNKKINTPLFLIDPFYKVYKIDSINTYYIIYAKRNDSLFKIVSKKDKENNGKKIQINFTYEFILNSIWYKKIMLGNVNISPSSSLHINCLSFDDSTKICLERDSVNDLHYADNLRGLYLIKQK